MSERIGIVAVAQTKYQKSRPDVRESELVYEVVEKLLTETGLRFTDDGTGIDAAVTCSHDHWDGVTISSWPIADVTGGHLRPEEKVAEDGIFAAYYAFIQILSGHYDVVLVTAHTKESQTSKNLIENSSFDPVYHQMLGLDYTMCAALQAKRYMYKYGITEEQCARVVVKNKKNACKNPNAQEPAELEIGDVLSSRPLAYPIRYLDKKPTSDGACAMILAREEKAKKLTDRPVWIEGVGSCYEGYYIGDRELGDCENLIKAAKSAYRMAGISDPKKEIGVFEISEEYSYQELLWTEGLGLCDKGRGGTLIESGATALDGEIPVNPSGGLLSGVPTNVAGLSRVAEAVIQLQGKGGDRQVSARKALAQGMCGPCGQLQCVMVLGI
nr:thiolase family protein [Desulfobacterales bacterium]